MKKLFLILSMMLVIISGKSYAEEDFYAAEQATQIDYKSLNIVENKVYFSCDQITLSNEGIYVLVPVINGNFIRLAMTELHYDKTGIFISLENFQLEVPEYCRYGHRLCNKCKKCSNVRCPTVVCRCGGRRR